MSASEDLPYRDVLHRISELASWFLENPDPEVSANAEELLDWIDAYHRDGLGRLIDMVRAWRGEIFLESVARDEIAGTFLASYGLGEDRDVDEDAIQSVREALDEIRPYAESHGGAIELEAVTDGVVRVKMLGSCDGCPSSAATLTHGVEEALRRHWPSFRRLEVVDSHVVAEADYASPDPAVLIQIRGHEGA